MKLDDRDRQILAALERDAWLSYTALAERVHLSASAVQRRVERLIADGAIEGAQARISPKARQRPLRIFVLVELKDESSSNIAALAKRLQKEADVVDLHYVAGPWDIVLTLQCAGMPEYAAFAERCLNGSAFVRRYRTLTSLRALNGD